MANLDIYKGFSEEKMVKTRPIRLKKLMKQKFNIIVNFKKDIPIVKVEKSPKNK